MFKILSILLFSTSVFSAESIPFLYQKEKTTSLNAQASKNPIKGNKDYREVYSQLEYQNKETAVSEIPIGKVEEILKTWKESLCKVNKNGEFKFWLKIDAGGKLFGIGTGGESGVEVLIKCI